MEGEGREWQLEGHLKSLVRGTVIATDDKTIQAECGWCFHLDCEGLFLLEFKK